MSEFGEDRKQDIQYFDTQKHNLTTITSSIVNDNCVLILGPLFGRNVEGKEIHEDIRRYLQEDGLVKLDDEYQNLFIIEDKKDTADMVIEDLIGSSYEKIKPDDVYNKLAKIKFNAIVTFTQDIFLLNAFDTYNFNYLFTYFSISKALSEFEKLPKGDNDKELSNSKKVPFIYNVFGHYKHAGSLIYSYDKFYKFLFSLLGENKAFPDELVTRFSNARVFLFMGFDLKKWYVPLFITKFCKLGRENNSVNPIIIASINNTDRANSEYLRWLLRYPLQLRLIENTYCFINKLISLNDNSLLRQKDSHLIGNTIEIQGLTDSQRQDYLDRIGELVEDNQLLNIIDDLRNLYRNKNDKNITSFLINLRTKLKRILFRNMNGEVTSDQYEVEITTIRNNIMYFIDNEQV